MCQRHTESLKKVKNMLCDGGCTGKPFGQAMKDTLGCSVEVIKRSELHEFVVLPKHWVVEQTFAWLENYRRLWKNCERTLENSRHSCLLVSVAILLKRF
ncbi:transposase [Bacillus mycoides]|uniref:transposase n=1 Tax=Bacillus mycoides TaxID=1405 RepID=UPI003D65E5A3